MPNATPHCTWNITENTNYKIWNHDGWSCRTPDQPCSDRSIVSAQSSTPAITVFLRMRRPAVHCTLRLYREIERRSWVMMERMVNKDKAAWHCKVYEAVEPIKLQNYALISLSQSSHHARASAALENCCICFIYLSHLDYITPHTAYCIEVSQSHSNWLGCTQEGVN